MDYEHGYIHALDLAIIAVNRVHATPEDYELIIKFLMKLQQDHKEIVDSMLKEMEQSQT